MGYLIGLVAMLVMLVGAGGYGAKRAETAAKEHWEPIVSQLKAEKQTLLNENAAWNEKLATAGNGIEACNAEVKRIKADSDDAIAAMREIKARSDANAAQMLQMIAKYKAGIVNTTVPVDQQCAEAKRVLGDLSDDMLHALGLDSTAGKPKAPALSITAPTPEAPKPKKSAIKLPGFSK